MAVESAPGAGIVNVRVFSIASWALNPRKTFDEEGMKQLVESVKAQGVLQNIVVRRLPDGPHDIAIEFEVIAGERRLRAAKHAGLTEIPARILPDDTTDAQAFELAMRENMDRQSLAPLDEAAGYQQMLTLLHIKQETLAEKLGIGQSTIANSLRLLQLPAPVQDEVRKGRLSKSVALVLCQLSDHPADCAEIAFEAAESGFSQRQAEQLVGARLKNIKAAEKERQSNLALPMDDVPAKTDKATETPPVEAPAPVAASTGGGDDEEPTDPFDGEEDSEQETETDEQPAEGAPSPEPAPATAATPADAGTAAPAPASVTPPTAPATDAVTRPVAPAPPPAAPKPAPVPAPAAPIPTNSKPVTGLLWADQQEWLAGQGLSVMTALDRLRNVNPSAEALDALTKLNTFYSEHQPGEEPLTLSETLDLVLIVQAKNKGLLPAATDATDTEPKEKDSDG